MPSSNPLRFDESTVVVSALHFAAQKHRDQRRKDNVTPYINHPIDLLTILTCEADIRDPEVLAAALLHDTLEDTDTQPEELTQLFGVRIRDLVLEMTDDKSLSQAERKRLQQQHAPALSYKARLIKLADKTANLRDLIVAPPLNWSLQRKQEYFEWAKSVVDQIRGTHATLEGIFDQAYAGKPQGVPCSLHYP
ncbi:MAG: HD domain-containing protein [Synechococcales cyanobacterium]